MAAVILLGLFGSSLALVLFSLVAIRFAPQGYEDETGFHFGPEKSSELHEGYASALAGSKGTI